ncbi:MAG TPA: hypothetical protein VFG82_06115, partial [Rubrobacter sp.]|nr:hypothetical protein [Rubrobacter sp.]
YRDPGAVDPAVRDLVREMNLIALQSEASGLGEIRASTLIVALDRPEIVARSGLLAHSIPHAQRILMDGTAHLPNMEMPGEFNRTVLKFLPA